MAKQCDVSVLVEFSVEISLLAQLFPCFKVKTSLGYYSVFIGLLGD